MPSRLKAFIQYLFIIGITVLLVWMSLRGLDTGGSQGKLDYLLMTWKKASKWWLALMAVIAMISHFIRAVRWKMLLDPAGQPVRTIHSFLSMMVGYLVNMVIPRGGEISRCYNLYKLNKVPVEVSFGTVVVERIVDLICFAVLIIIVFLIEAQKLFAFFNTLPVTTGELGGSLQIIIFIALAGMIFLLILYLVLRKNERIANFIRKTWQGTKKGLLTITKLKHKGLFVFYSVFIWFLYFLMSYAVMFAFPATASLGFNAVLSLFAIGSLAMAIPLPGGTGSYHTLVPAGLVFLYQVPQTDAVAFTFIFHGWQTVILIAAGAVSLIITSIKVKRHSRKASNSK